MGKLKKTACIAAMLVTMTALLLNTSSEEAVRTINMPEAAEAAPIELLPQIPQAIERIYLRAENLPKPYQAVRNGRGLLENRGRRDIGGEPCE